MSRNYALRNPGEIPPPRSRWLRPGSWRIRLV